MTTSCPLALKALSLTSFFSASFPLAVKSDAIRMCPVCGLVACAPNLIHSNHWRRELLRAGRSKDKCVAAAESETNRLKHY